MQKKNEVRDCLKVISEVIHEINNAWCKSYILEAVQTSNESDNQKVPYGYESCRTMSEKIELLKYQFSLNVRKNNILKE